MKNLYATSFIKPLTYNYLHLSLTHKSAYEKRLVRGAVPKITAPATWKTDSAESSAHKFFELSPKHASI